MQRIRFVLGLLAAAVIFSTSAKADDLFQMSWRGVEYTKDGSGNLTSRRITEREFINRVSQTHNVDPRDLVFVWRANKLDTAVVRASTGEFVANVIQMEYVYTEVGNDSQTAAVRQAFLFDEWHDAALGSAVGIERLRRNSSGALTGYSFRGNFNYAYPESGRIISGSFATGKRILERF